jgi:hypothetical protein
VSAVARAIRPRPVFCVIDGLYRDRAVADAVRRGRFTHGGIALDLGPEPDWLTRELPPDPEWQIEWRKFYYGLDLAHAFRATGDAGYLEAWERLVRAWIRQVPPDSDRSDVTARRVLNWIYAWLRFAASPAFEGLTPGMAESIVASISGQLRHVHEHLTPERNHRTFELYALFVSLLALPDLDMGVTLDFVLDELHRNLLTDVRADGVHREASTHYHHVALRTYLGVYENARRFSIRLPESYRERLERACEFAMHCHRPDGAIPALSDSDTGSYLDLLELAAGLLSRPDFLYVATGGARGDPPSAKYASFPHAGYFIQRSGWGEGPTPFAAERYLILDCGPLGDGGHGHYDLLSVEIAAGGAPLIVDPGRYVYSEEAPNWRRWFKSTAAHNTVSVDGLDQTAYRRGAPNGPVAQGRLLHRLSAAGLDVLWGECHSPCYEVVHRRRVLFVADEYWIIEDRLVGERPHRYDLRFHLAPEACDRTTLAVADGQSVARAPGLALVTMSRGAATIEQGWFAPLYGDKLPAPTVSVRAEGTPQAAFITLVAPLAADRPVPEVRVDHGPTSTRVEIATAGPAGTIRDVVAWSASPDPVMLEPVGRHARVAWVRELDADDDRERHATCL